MRNIEDLRKLMNSDGLVHFNGEYFTPEELAEVLELTGGFEIVEKEEKSWFEKALTGE